MSSDGEDYEKERENYIRALSSGLVAGLPDFRAPTRIVRSNIRPDSYRHSRNTDPQEDITRGIEELKFEQKSLKKQLEENSKSTENTKQIRQLLKDSEKKTEVLESYRAELELITQHVESITASMADSIKEEVIRQVDSHLYKSIHNTAHTYIAMVALIASAILWLTTQLGPTSEQARILEKIDRRLDYLELQRPQSQP